MNYPIPFFYPYPNIKILEEKIDYLEERIKILEKILLKKENDLNNNHEEPTDMYMI